MGLVCNLLAKDGMMFIFEHNPYNPLTKKAVNTCPFDEGVVLLKPKEFFELIKNTDLEVVKNRYCLFFPSVLKKLAFLENLLPFIPMGGQYVVELKKSKNSN